MSFINFHYKTGEVWSPLPDWGNFFVDLGVNLTQYKSRQKRIIIGIVIPTRAYAASLISLGATIGILSSQTQSKTEIDKYFQQLCTLEKGTQLLYRARGKRHRVFVGDIEIEQGVTRLCLQYAPNHNFLITSKQALDVEFPSKVFTSFSKRASRPTPLTQSPFLTHTLSSIDSISTLTSQSALDSLTIGSIYQHKEELLEKSFAIKTDNDFIQGSLQEIIRARKFIKGAQTYRSDIFYVNNNECENRNKEIPFVTIFNGATSYLKWRHIWNWCHCVVLLDQTEQDFDIAIQIFNNEFTQLSTVDGFRSFDQLPPYIPMAIYEEECQ